VSRDPLMLRNLSGGMTWMRSAMTGIPSAASTTSAPSAPQQLDGQVSPEGSGCGMITKAAPCPTAVLAKSFFNDFSPFAEARCHHDDRAVGLARPFAHACGVVLCHSSPLPFCTHFSLRPYQDAIPN